MLAGLAAPVSLPAAAPLPIHPALVTTPGHADLRKCRDWLGFDACRSYHDIAIPVRIRRGDRFRLVFGSNPKSFLFRVVDIILTDQGCWLQAAANPSGAPGLAVDTLTVMPCHAEPAPSRADPDQVPPLIRDPLVKPMALKRDG